jgi:ABC-type nitrate/sulfonate/bicarbonate transport system substrate-binding protein
LCVIWRWRAQRWTLAPAIDALAADPPPETTRLRIAEIPSTCRSPEWIAADLLRAEGFTDVQYNRVSGTLGVERALASGEADISGHFAAPVIVRLEAGDPSSFWAASTSAASSFSRPTGSGRSGT